MKRIKEKVMAEIINIMPYPGSMDLKTVMTWHRRLQLVLKQLKEDPELDHLISAVAGKIDALERIMMNVVDVDFRDNKLTI